MLILGKARAKDSTKGYAATFLQHLDAALEHLVANGIRLVVNAGGLNPAGLADATRELIARRGYDLRVSHIEGDDVFGRLDALQQAGHSLPHLTSGEPLSSWPHQPLTANAYLGGFGIARALANGADIVITGRVADASVVVGPAAWWWSWTPNDYDALAGALAAGHVIECGPQATGGNFSGFRTIADLVQPGFPIAEIDADGSSVITKNPGTGGAVTRDTVTAQLLYEIGEPAYLNSDVTTHLDTAALTDLGDDRVEIRGVRGSAPPATTKVAITGVGGWENSMLLALTGTDLDAKAALIERSVHRYTDAVDGLDPSRSTVSGRPSTIPTARTPEPSCSGSPCKERKRLPGARFPRGWSSWPCPATPGCTRSARHNPGQRSVSTGPHCSTKHCSSTRSTTMTARPRPSHSAITGRSRESTPPAATPTAQTTWSDELVVASLGEIVHARSGDKGGDANLGVWVRDRASVGVAQVDPDRRRTAAPSSRNTRIGRSSVTNCPTSARSTSSSEDCSGPAPPRHCGWTRRPKHSANGCAHAAPRCHARLSNRRREPMNGPDESTIDVVRKATRELARNFDYAYWRQKDKRGEYPWEFVKAFAQGGWLGALIPERVRRAGARHRGVRRDDAGNRRLGRRREWRLRGPLLPVPTRARSSGTARRR